MLITRDHGRELDTPPPGGDGNDQDSKAAAWWANTNTKVLAPRRTGLNPEISLHEMRGAQSVPSTMSSTMAARRTLSAFRPDFSHPRVRSDRRLEVASSHPGVPRLLTIHDVTAHPGAITRSKPERSGVTRRTRRDAKGFVVHGECLRQKLLEVEHVREGPVFVIPDAVLSHGSSMQALPDKRRLLFIVRMEQHKGLDTLIEALDDERSGVLRGPNDAGSIAVRMLVLLSDHDRLAAISRDASTEALTGRMSPRHIAELPVDAHETLIQRQPRWP
jgi:hypothetical protein